MTQNNTVHDKAIVGFLDILGYDSIVKKMINNTGFVKQFDDLMYGITVNLRETFKNLELSQITGDESIDQAYFVKIVDSIKVRFIYDNIIFSLQLSDASFRSQEYDKNTTIQNCIETFFSLMSMFSTIFIGKTGSLLRGGISLGSHYESEKNNYLMIFSEAHNKAVRLEGAANYPRIILEDGLRTYLEEISYTHIDKFFYKDQDGYHCFNIYSVFYVIGITKDVLTDINKGISLNLESNIGNKKELSKLIYFAKYHNEQVGSDCLNFPDLALDIAKFEKMMSNDINSG